jgi:hypothetical protein
MSDPNSLQEEVVQVPAGLGETPVPELEIKTNIIGDEEEFVPEETVRLPVGISKDGVRYREVTLEEMCGIDEHLVAKKDSQQNGALATSRVLCRCIQEVEGLLPKKPNPETQFDRSLAKALAQPDRDFLLSRIQLLGGNDWVIMAGKCPRCNAVWEENTRLSQLPVNHWPDDKPLYLEFELIRGVPIMEKGKVVGQAKKGKLRFPTGADQEMAGSLSTLAEQMDGMLAACIFDLEGIGTLDSGTVKRLKSTDRQHLMEMVSRELPGLRQWKEVKCDCGKKFAISVDLTSFFDARRRREKK